MRKQIVVSDFSGEVVEPGEITLRFADRRRGVYVAEAVAGDEVVRRIVSSGRRQMPRGRPPKEQPLAAELLASAAAAPRGRRKAVAS